jgi:hypothetical protein
MKDWLYQIDPTVLLGILGSVFGVLWRKGAKAAAADVLEKVQKSLLAVFEAEVIKLTQDPETAETKARDALEAAAAAALDRLKVKRNAAIDFLVHHLIDLAMAELHRRVTMIRDIQKRLGQVGDTASSMLDMLNKATSDKGPAS